MQLLFNSHFFKDKNYKFKTMKILKINSFVFSNATTKEIKYLGTV